MRYARWLLTVTLIWPVAALLANDADSVKLVTTGQITGIDAKHQTFQFKFRLDQPPQYARPVGQPYPRRGGIGGRPRRGGGYPSRTPNGGQSIDDRKEVKVFTSDATGFKNVAGALQFSDLKTGDQVTLTAIRKGHGDDLEAQIVTRH
jgi:hypothetical protein